MSATLNPAKFSGSVSSCVRATDRNQEILLIRVLDGDGRNLEIEFDLVDGKVLTESLRLRSDRDRRVIDTSLAGGSRTSLPRRGWPGLVRAEFTERHIANGQKVYTLKSGFALEGVVLSSAIRSNGQSHYYVLHANGTTEWFSAENVFAAD